MANTILESTIFANLSLNSRHSLFISYLPWQVGVGIDDFDAHAYDIAEMSAYAGSQGFSTSYWAWNPTTQAQFDASSLKIFNSYGPSVTLATPIDLDDIRVPPPGGI